MTASMDERYYGITDAGRIDPPSAGYPPCDRCGADYDDHALTNSSLSGYTLMRLCPDAFDRMYLEPDPEAAREAAALDKAGL